MIKQKPIDETAGRIGTAMYNARVMRHLSRNEVSALLCIMPDELAAYERGVKKIPHEILQHVFIMGYKMMRFRNLEDRYRAQRKFLRKLKQTVTDMP